MTDIRALIAVGRALLATFDETPATDRAFDVAGWAGVHLMRELLDALEEVLREPVGFIVLAKRASDVTPGKTNYRTPSPIFHRDDQGLAEYSLRSFRDGLVDAERMWHGQCEYVLGEVREVR